MAKYRIVKKWDRMTEYTYFVIQKKVLGLLWLPLNTRITQESAEYYVKKLMSPDVEDEVIAEYGT